MTFVLDNSVALAWCFKDEQTPAVMALLDRATEAGASAPGLWPLEAVNGLMVAERKRRISAATREELVGFLRDLPIMLDGETGGRAWEATARLAERFRLSAYDAAYLELAERRGMPLATLDGDLRKAAGIVGVALLGS